MVNVSILKKADSETSSTFSDSSEILCEDRCKLKVQKINISSHDCFARLRQELNDSYGRIDDLEDQLKQQRKTYQQTEHVLRKQIKRLKQELAKNTHSESESTICVTLSRQKGSFGFKLLGLVQNSEDGEKGGVSIASLTYGAPAQKNGRIYIYDKILEIDSIDVSSSTCSVVEGIIRNSPGWLIILSC